MRNIRFRLDYIFLEFLFLMGLFSGYVGHMAVWRLILIVFCIFMIIQGKTFQNGIRNIFSFLWLVILLLILIVISSCISTSHIYTYSNVKLLLSGLIIITVMLIISENNDLLVRFLLRKFWIINIWLGINLLVVIIQNSGYPLFIKNEWIDNNPYYPDLCCGLFGGARTNTLALFCCFSTVYNLVYIKKLIGIRKFLLKVWINISVALILWTSTQNDNLAVFILLPLSCAIYFLLYERNNINIINILKRTIKLIVVLLTILGIVYQIPTIKEFLDDVLFVRFDKMVNYENYGGAYGSNERLAIFIYALDSSSGWLFGKGIGVSQWRQVDAFGFKHYGLSSIGTVTNLIGIWAYLLLTIIYSLACLKISKLVIKGNSKRALIPLLMTAFVSLYTELYTTEVLAYWYIMWYAVYSIELSKDIKIED